MTKQPESRLSGEIQRELRKKFLNRIFVYKNHGNEHMMAGLPDIVGVAMGAPFAIETKMPDKRSNTSARQDYVHANMNLAGWPVRVCCSVEEALQWVDEAIDLVWPPKKEKIDEP